MAQPPRKKTTGNLPRKSPSRGAHTSQAGQTGQAGADADDEANEATVPIGQPVTRAAADGGARRGSSSTNLPAARPTPRSGAGTGSGRFQPVNERGNFRPGENAANRSGRAAQIGSLKLKGWPMALKFSLAISLLVILALVLFGWVAIGTIETQLNNGIVNSGYSQLLALHPFAQKVMQEFQGERSEKELMKKLYDYNEKRSAADKWYIKNFLDSVPRVYDVAIFASNQPVDNPRLPVLQGRAALKFADPASSPHIKVNLPEANPEVLVYKGVYATVIAGVEHKEYCLYFRMPVREAASDKNAEKGERMYASLNLIMSDKEIQDEISGLKRKLLLIGLLLAVIAVAFALMLARFTTQPIKTLVADMNEVAHGNFEYESAVDQTSHDEVGLLASAFNQMTASLKSGRESELENQRISGELNTAKAIHIKLMPEKLPQLPGIDIFTAYQSAKEVGGDYYDFIPVGDSEHLALCVADVSGKGIPGSMVMGTTRTILRMMAVGNLSSADVLSKTNYHVARDIKRGMFVTCVYCILNVRTREMTVASAGHNPLLLYRGATGELEKIRPNGIALGFDKGPVFNRTIREERIQLEPGDRVVLYTDGVVEAMNEAREEFSDEALDEFTLRHATLPSKEYVRLLIKALEEHKGAAEQHDDITITTFRIV